MKEALFMGVITASVTHELQNVLAIIKESSGLMEDILGMCRGKELKHADKFKKAMNLIQEQIERGRRLSHALNRFAHTPADDSGADMNSCVETIVTLSQRFAKVKNCSFVAESCHEPLNIRSNALTAMRLVYEAMSCCTVCLASCGGHIGLRLGKENRLAVVTVMSPANQAVIDSEGFAELRAEAERLGLRADSDALGMRLYFPLIEEGCVQ